MPDLKGSAEGTPEKLQMQFDSGMNGAASVLPTTANTTARTVDVVWYGGATVSRINRKTGDEYMLRLDMAGCNMDRLNAGAPVFDNHMGGDDFPSAMAGTLGLKAQIGVVRKAWADGNQGKATLQFAAGDPNSDAIWAKISSGIVQNLSFGTWINEMKPDESVGPNGYPEDDDDQSGPQSFVATNWEPFEISPVCVPADFNTAFLSADGTGPVPLPLSINGQPFTFIKVDNPTQTVTVFPSIPETKSNTSANQPKTTRASARKETPMETQAPQAGTEARTEQLIEGVAGTALLSGLPPVNAEALRKEGIEAERKRQTDIRAAASPFLGQLEEKFVNSLIDSDISLEAAREKILTQLAARTDKTPTVGEAVIMRDQTDTRRENMEASLLYKYDPKTYAPLKEKAREYAADSLIDLATECLQAVGVKTRGITKEQKAALALQGRYAPQAEQYFSSAYASTSDFPKILENVANKTMRQAYEIFPSNWKAFSRPVTANDFKPLNRVQLSDFASLPSLNEDGEYHRLNATDSKETYSLASYGGIVAISRKAIINDDMGVFTRIPGQLGTAAARREADTVWAVLTSPPTMSDSIALFHASHSNLNSGAGSALSDTALATARTAMRLQTAPKGSPLNLTPRYLLIPAALEQTAEKLVAPTNIASSDYTKVIPDWIRSLNPIVEPRLDAASGLTWYFVADPATIDTIEYCYLAGQEGVYTETRMGFDVDGFEIKARMDFAAAAVEYRGLQQNVGG